jgi:hypothetical protein
MVEGTTYSDARIRSEASDSVRTGDDIRERVRHLTLAALRDRRFDGSGMRDVVRAVTEGVATGAERSSSVDMRIAFAEALSGLDSALRTSADAGYSALKQLSSTGRSFSDKELKQAIGTMRRLEEDFLDTVSQVADSASAQVQPPLREALAQTRRAGTATGRQVALTMTEFAQRFSIASIDATVSGLEVAGEVGARFAALASGILSGLAEALRPAQPTPYESRAADFREPSRGAPGDGGAVAPSEAPAQRDSPLAAVTPHSVPSTAPASPVIVVPTEIGGRKDT